MKLATQVTNLMGRKVSYCRAKPDDKGVTELYKGTGVIVGVIVGASRRVQILVKDAGTEKNQAITLDPICVDYTEADAQKYWEHHQMLKGIVEKHNADQKQREADKIKEVDAINAKMFGAELEI